MHRRNRSSILSLKLKLKLMVIHLLVRLKTLLHNHQTLKDKLFLNLKLRIMIPLRYMWTFHWLKTINSTSKASKNGARNMRMPLLFWRKMEITSVAMRSRRCQSLNLILAIFQKFFYFYT